MLNLVFMSVKQYVYKKISKGRGAAEEMKHVTIKLLLQTGSYL